MSVHSSLKIRSSGGSVKTGQQRRNPRKRELQKQNQQRWSDLAEKNGVSVDRMKSLCTQEVADIVAKSAPNKIGRGPR